MIKAPLLPFLAFLPAVCLAAAENTPLPADHAARMKAGTALFTAKIRPALETNCLDCHGGEKTRAEFDLATRDLLFKGGESGPVIDLQSPGASFLLAVLRHEEEPHMPAKKPKLSDALLSDFQQWIELGAPYDRPLIEKDPAAPKTELTVTDTDRQFWSFRPLSSVAPPASDEAWERTDIDRFVLAQLSEHGLKPSAPADDRAFIRRAYLDLIGLPPTLEQLESALRIPRSELIDSLLNSPHYGERWARHWLDAARFGESHGFEQDYNREHAYHYRDFVIRALNADMPYDQFTRWQLAGDELAPDDPQALMATGFLGAGAFPTQLTEKEFESARYDELDDMAGTMGTAMLGLTIGCARCHDHKFDPIPVKDYYRLVSTFTTTIRSEIMLPVPEEEFQRQRTRWEARQEQLKKELEAAKDADKPAKQRALDEHLKLEPKDGKALVQVTSEGFPPTKHHADGRGFPHFYPETHFLSRGDANQKLGVAEQGFLQVLMREGQPAAAWQSAPPEGARTSHRRTALANWIVDTEGGAGHLLARVIVNRLWHHHFGRGIVATPNDFGLQGQAATHPELLDFLAQRLMEHGWRLKPLHRDIMLSAAYQQSSAPDEENAAIDPDNRWLWRFQPRRLEAEVIRDSILAASGQLDPAMFGKGTLSEGHQRRSIYFTIKRSQLIPMMQIFDQPEPLVSQGGRPSTVIAPQALLFMNNPQVVSWASGMASLVERANPDDSIREVYLRTLSRDPSGAELESGRAFLATQTASYGTTPSAARLALADYCQAVFGLNEFVYLP